jgi:hypothetical protein
LLPMGKVERRRRRPDRPNKNTNQEPAHEG